MVGRSVRCESFLGIVYGGGGVRGAGQCREFLRFGGGGKGFVVGRLELVVFVAWFVCWMFGVGFVEGGTW